MTIFRVVKDEDYTIVANEPIEDERLSWGARGLLIYLLSKPDDWKISTAHLIKQSPAGGHALNTLIKELKEAGYLRRVRYRLGEGTFAWETHVYEQPTIPQLSTNGSSMHGKPPHVVSTDLLITEKERVSPNGDGKPPPSRKKKSPPRDSRIDHPAYQVYQELARLSVPHAWRDEVCKIDDIEKWRGIVKSWLGKHKPTNIEGMIDVYNHGWKDGRGKPASSPQYREVYK